MKIGTTEIQKVYLGTTELDGLYVGSNSAYVKPSSAGIDEHTVLMAHFDDNIDDVSQYTNSGAVQQSATPVYVTGKFGNAINLDKYITYTCQDDLFKNLHKTDCTIDFWTKKEDIDTYFALLETSNGGACAKYLMQISGDTFTAYSGLTGSLSGISSGAWFHVALTSLEDPEDASKTKLNLYINGVYQNSYSRAKSTAGSCARIKVHTNNIDEYRVSNIVRYNGNFTPPTQPYSN